MANVIPQQLCLRDGAFCIENECDTKKSPSQVSDLLASVLGDSYERISFGNFRNVCCGKYTKYDGSKIFFIVANLTFMGGREGQHPKDLKRIQYNVEWRNFYNHYSSGGTVMWLGLYSYKGINIWTFFKPESYLQKHIGKSMISKGGFKANYSCHIYLNDLKIGYENGGISLYHKKIDKNKNTVGAIRFDCLKGFFEGELKGINPIISKITEINDRKIVWNNWIRADEAIPYMKSLISTVGFTKWKENLWNGWLVEAYYSEYLNIYPSNYLYYVATTQNQQVKKEYKYFGLDLAFPGQKDHFIGDLKAVSIGDDDTYLNDETKVNEALHRYKKIWFVFYIHQKRKGSTNDYEMVRWRNHYIMNEGNKDGKIKYSELSAKNTPHSIKFTEMVIIELNDITKDKYFFLRKQGVNSNGKARKDKYAISKKTLRIINDDSFVIARYNYQNKE